MLEFCVGTFLGCCSVFGGLGTAEVRHPCLCCTLSWSTNQCVLHFALGGHSAPFWSSSLIWMLHVASLRMVQHLLSVRVSTEMTNCVKLVRIRLLQILYFGYFLGNIELFISSVLFWLIIESTFTVTSFSDSHVGSPSIAGPGTSTTQNLALTHWIFPLTWDFFFQSSEFYGHCNQIVLCCSFVACS